MADKQGVGMEFFLMQLTGVSADICYIFVEELKFSVS